MGGEGRVRNGGSLEGATEGPLECMRMPATPHAHLRDVNPLFFLQGLLHRAKLRARGRGEEVRRAARVARQFARNWATHDRGGLKVQGKRAPRKRLDLDLHGASCCMCVGVNYGKAFYVCVLGHPVPPRRRAYFLAHIEV